MRQDWLIKRGQPKQDQGSERLALINIKFTEFSQLPHYADSSTDPSIGENTQFLVSRRTFVHSPTPEKCFGS